jgi:hypothetical protein
MDFAWLGAGIAFFIGCLVLVGMMTRLFREE